MSRKRMTAAEAKRTMKSELERLSALELPAPPLEDQYELILSGYFPRSVDPARWNAGMGDFVRDLMRRGHVRGEKVFRQMLSELTLYVDWALDHCVTLTIDEMMRHDTIERWVATAGATGSDSTWGNRRSRLRNLASHVNPGPGSPKKGEPFARVAIKEPYTRREVADLERLALNQPTEVSRRQLCAMVGLGLGAGLGSDDLRSLRVSAIVLDEDGKLWVVVPGKRPRRVPVRDRFVRFVLLGIEGLKATDLVLGHKVERNNITSGVVANAAVGMTNVVPDQARLRTTWLLALMTAPVPLATLLDAAGMTTGRTITDLLPFCFDPAYVKVEGGEL
jgi:integrase